MILREDADFMGKDDDFALGKMLISLGTNNFTAEHCVFSREDEEDEDFVRGK